MSLYFVAVLTHHFVIMLFQQSSIQCSVLIFLSLIVFSKTGGVKFLQLRKCESTDNETVSLKACAIGPQGFNLSYDVVFAYKKVFVSLIEFNSKL